MPGRQTANWEYTLSITGRRWKPDSYSVAPTKIANSSRAVAPGVFPSLETTLAFAQHRQATLEVELAPEWTRANSPP